MSTTSHALAGTPAYAPGTREDPRRRLRVVEEPAQRRRPRLVYGVVAVMGAFLIAAAQMSLSIMTTQGSYELSALTQEQRDLTYQKQILYDDVAGLSSPQYLAANASAMGMVIDESPSYLRLSDGALLGAGEVALGSSSVNAIGRGTVPNALITQTPLVTAPEATIGGAPAAPVDVEAGTDAAVVGGGGVVDTPPPITDGLPTPSTH